MMICGLMVYIEAMIINLKRILKTNMVLIEREKQILFLENLLIKLKNNHLSDKEQRELSEFYINYMFIHFFEKFQYYRYLFALILY